MTTAQHLVLGLFCGLLGLCVGSFLNVVIYRLPRGLSVRKPKRSFCPHCRKGISFFDNIPVLSWLLLRGKCRHCSAPISVQYPLVEAMTGFLFCLTYYLLFYAEHRVGLTEISVPGDVPILLSWLVLVAAMVACSATDLVSYMVDTRVTNVAVLAGVLLHAVWPRTAFVESVGAHAGGLIAVLMGIATIVMLMLPFGQDDGEDEEEDTPSESETNPKSFRLLGLLTTLLFIAVGLWLLASMSLGSNIQRINEIIPVPVGFFLVFIAIVAIGGQHRDADDELHAEIEEEAPTARKTALKDLLWLTPILVIGVVGFFLHRVPEIHTYWQNLAHWSLAWGMTPIAGAGYAVYSAIIGAAAGWLLRIVFTLAFGREAFGVGDIYILAAAGATAGWDIALIGLVLSVGLALVGWIFSLLMKSTVMIPFGPWLALGFLMALWVNHQAAEIASHYAGAFTNVWEKDPRFVSVLVGIFLVGSVVACFLARLVRRFVEPE